MTSPLQIQSEVGFVLSLEDKTAILIRFVYKLLLTTTSNFLTAEKYGEIITMDNIITNNNKIT